VCNINNTKLHILDSKAPVIIAALLKVKPKSSHSCPSAKQKKYFAKVACLSKDHYNTSFQKPILSGAGVLSM
jgi:hypothetical protein